MKKTYNLLISAIIAVASITCLANATKHKAPLLPASKARAAYNEHRIAGAVQYNPHQMDGNNAQLPPSNGEVSIIKLHPEKEPNDKIKCREYEFGIHRDGLATFIAYVKQGSKQITYTQEIHDSIKDEMQEDLREIIEEDNKK